MSETKEHDQFLADLQKLLDSGVDTSHTEMPQGEDLVFEGQKRNEQPAAQVEKPKASATPSSQPVEPSTPETATAAREDIAELEPIELKGSDALSGVLDFSGEEVAQGEHEERSDKSEKSTKRSGVKLKLVVCAIVLLAAGYLMLPADVPAPMHQLAQTEQPAQPAGQPISKAVEPTDPTMVSAPGAYAAPSVPAAQLSGLDLSVMGESPQSQESLVAEIARDQRAIPAEEQTCSSGHLSNGERSVCNKTGHLKFFQCTSGTGRIWDVRLPGCEVI